MGLKAVELQVAIPRSQDAGRMQEQAMRQGQQFQDTLTQQQLSEQITNRTKVNEYDNVQDKNVTDDEEDERHGQEQKQQKEKRKQSKEHMLNHPYLGTKVDFSG